VFQDKLWHLHTLLVSDLSCLFTIVAQCRPMPYWQAESSRGSGSHVCEKKKKTKGGLTGNEEAARQQREYLLPSTQRADS
jgi:hypothetical protein